MFLEILEEYHLQGFKVPKISFVTKAESVRHMGEIYNDIYKSHPEFEHHWYKINGKPMIIGNNNGNLSEEVKNFFTIKYAQWPREEYHDDGFPWVDFTRPQQLYGKETGPSVMSVSVAQHLGTLAFSSGAFYGDERNASRSYHNGSIDKSEEAYKYGYNFAEQFEYAIEISPDIIFVTGWNEWIATRQTPGSWKYTDGTPNNDPIILVDSADIENSRDIQPMRGGYGDNYYMQLISYIRKFKGLNATNSKYTLTEKTYGSINFENGFSDWNDIGATYYDYTGDTLHRDNRGYGREVYINDTGRNDIVICKTAVDDGYIYFYAETKDILTSKEDKHWMSLFIGTNNNDKTWYGYDYVLNRISPTDNEAVLEKNNGGWKWSETSRVKFMTEGNKLQVAIPLSELGYTSYKDVKIQFKWADNYQENNNDVDFFSFYLDGDSAPYGRLNFIFEY